MRTVFVNTSKHNSWPSSRTRRTKRAFKAWCKAKLLRWGRAKLLNRIIFHISLIISICLYASENDIGNESQRTAGLGSDGSGSSAILCALLTRISSASTLSQESSEDASPSSINSPPTCSLLERSKSCPEFYYLNKQ